MENIDIREILKTVDHTLLTQTTTLAEIKGLCDDGIKYGVASVCIPPCYVKAAREYVGDSLKICTVIGFPNGYQKTEVKVFETNEAIADGADEVDMVINIAKLRDKDFRSVKEEICALRKAADRAVLKVIIETCLLDREEKIAMCGIVRDSGADFIKTSTGFSTGGATFEDIQLFRDNLPKGFGIKAAGGITSIDDAVKFLELGATRLGTSRIVKILKNQSGAGY